MMVFFKQFKLLLIQRLTLRKRQPIIFGLELFWPAIVFLAIFAIRFNFPPSFKNSCTYSSKALPSTGPINFVQSFVCTIDNPCLNDTLNEETTKFPKARIHKLIHHLKPLFENKKSDIEKLPKGIQLIESIVKTLSDPFLRNYLKNGLPMKDILRDESSLNKIKFYIKQSLKNSTKVFDKQVNNAIQILHFSSLNVIQLAQTFKNNNFNYTQDDYACDLIAFKNLLILHDKNFTQTLSTSNQINDTIEVLCELSNLGYLDGLLQLTQRSIDLVKVLHWLRTLLHILGLHKQQNHLNDVMHMLITVKERDMLSPSHKWNVSDDLQARIASLVEHIDHSKNGFVISLEKLTNKNVLNSLIQTIDHIKYELKPNSDYQLEQALEVITIGLNGLKYFNEQGLFKVQYKFYELIKNVNSVKLFMILQLQLEPSLIELIMSTTFDFTETVASNHIDPNLLCNRDALKNITNFNNSYLSYGYSDAAIFDIISNIICTLSSNNNYLFNEKLIRIFAIKKFGNNILDFISSGFLENNNITDFQNSLSGLKIVSSSMYLVQSFVHKFIEILDLDDHLSHLNLKGDGVDVLGSPQIANITGRIMCGKDLPAISNEFHLLKVNIVEKPKIDENELKNLKSDFCKNGYLQIMKMQGGPLIWSWLKPILSGKILFSPINNFTNLIIKELNNTFISMEEFIEIFKAWTETAKSLQHFYNNKNITKKLEQVGDFIPLVLNQEFEILSKDIKTIHLIENLSKFGGIFGLIELFSNIAQCFEMNRFIGFDNEYSLEQAAKKYSKSYDLIAGIVFMNLNTTYSKAKKEFEYNNIPKKINYKLRFDLDLVPGTKMLKDRIWEPGAKDHLSRDLGYFKGFVQLQELIDRAIIRIQLNQVQFEKQLKLNSYNNYELNFFSLDNEYKNTLINMNNFDLYNPSIYMQQFPYGCYKEDKFGFYILALSPVISTVAWIFLIAFSIRDFVLERELHLEEILYVTGLKPNVRWVIWFLFSFFILAFGCICGLLIFNFADIMPNSDFLLVYIYFLAFCFSIVMYCYMMSSFFKTATIASLSGIIIYLASFLPFMVAITLEHELKLTSKLISCLSMSTSFCFGIMYLARFESQGTGIQWSNIWQSPIAEDTMNFAYAGILMILDGFIYLIIGWYISNVFAVNDYVKKPFYFFLLPSYWKSWFNLSDSNSKNYKEKINSTNHRGIALHNLSVIYNQNDKKRKHHAVSGLSISFEEGQIATLLGKNGSGKTTTINVLTGILKPTSGVVYVYGQEFLKNFEQTRKLLGYCPQYNFLFDLLTVREHLEFFAKLKNLLDDDYIKTDVDKMLKSTGLFDIQHELAKNLSGGLQRRLCVALAFIGGSKLIILDEPTASVDPIARRQIWELIISQKSTKTVFLTTHHMDEADILSDSVAIIHKGQLLCFGSPLLLKNKFGCGYQLTISRQGNSKSKFNLNHLNKKNKINFSGIKNSIYNEFQNINNIEEYDNNHDDNEETVLENLNITDSDSGRVSNNSLHLNNEQNYKKCNEKLDIINSSENLMKFIRCLIPNALKLDENLNEIIIALPKSGIDGQAHDYSTFFQCLDSNINRFGYYSYGLTSTTLEEVFLTLCNLQETRFDFYSNQESKLNLAKKLNLTMNLQYSRKFQQKNNSKLEKKFNLCDKFDINQNKKFKKIKIYKGFLLKYMQFKGLMKKRAYHTFTNWKTVFYNLILPCIFIAFAMGMTTIKPNLAPDPILPLTPEIYGSEATSFFLSRKSILKNNFADNYSDKISKTISKQLFEINYSKSLHQHIKELECGKPRKGWKVSKCPIIKKNFETQFPTYLLNFSLNKTIKNNNLNQKCQCQECNHFNYLGNIDIPKLTNVGYIYNISDINNINYFLMKTFSLFNDRRYGGWSVHQIPTNNKLLIKKKNSTNLKNVWKVWFDNNGMHSIPSYLNTLNNALLRANLIELVGLSNLQANEYSINVFSHPFHLRLNQLGDQNLMQKAGDAGISLIILVGFVFIPTSFVFYIVKERVNEEKHMQRIFGVGTILYWISAIIWDMLIVFFSVLIFGGIIWSFQMPIYTTRLNFPAIILLLLLFGWAMISLVYLFEKFFNEASIAFMVIYCLTLFVGINTMVFRLLIDVFKLLQVSSIFKITFERIALIFPPFTLMSGLVDVTKNHLLTEMFMLINQDVYINPFSMKLLAPHYITLAIEGVVLFIINLIIELIKNNDFWFLNDCCLSFFCKYKNNKKSILNSIEFLDILDQKENHYDIIYDVKELKNYSKQSYVNKQQKANTFLVKNKDFLVNEINQLNEDHDVYEERKRIIISELQTNQFHINENWNKFFNNNATNNDILKVINVSKYFNSVNNCNKLAVNKISFGVPRGECFGLLGTNGAGKTTLFKILTGQIYPSSGITLFNEKKVDKILADTCKILGYCPQTDALDSTLTPKQHLSIYATIRGIKNSMKKQVIKDSLYNFQLNQYENFTVNSLSRGTRRKLCLAIAMLGNPEIILLDEPTSGMDPMSRRCLWQNIQNMIKEKRSVLMTSHSMEECDILCSRIAIMVDGKFSCLGSPQYLKRKFGYGYTITLKLNDYLVNYTKVISFIKKRFSSILLRAHHHNMLEFSLPTNNISLSKIFLNLNEAKEVLNLQDYSVSQTTLDQVFVNFASQEFRNLPENNLQKNLIENHSILNQKKNSTQNNLNQKNGVVNSFNNNLLRENFFVNKNYLANQLDYTINNNNNKKSKKINLKKHQIEQQKINHYQMLKQQVQQKQLINCFTLQNGKQ